MASSSISNENEDPKTRFSTYQKMTLKKEQSSPSRVSFIKDPHSSSLLRSKTIVNGRQKSFYRKSTASKSHNQTHNRGVDFNNNEDFEVERENKIKK